MKLRRVSMVVALSLMPAAYAGEAEICYSPSESALNQSQLTNDTVFTCPNAGSKTIPELAEDGWSVVQVSPIVVSGGNETQAAYQLVIERL